MFSGSGCDPKPTLREWRSEWGTRKLADLKFGHYMEPKREKRALAALGMTIFGLWDASGARRAVRADMGRGGAAPLRGEPKSHGENPRAGIKPALQFLCWRNGCFIHGDGMGLSVLRDFIATGLLPAAAC